MGRGKAPRKKPQKRTRSESGSSNSEGFGEFEGAPCPDGNNITMNLPPILPTAASTINLWKQAAAAAEARPWRGGIQRWRLVAIMGDLDYYLSCTLSYVE
jgi:hypothetical protein